MGEKWTKDYGKAGEPTFKIWSLQLRRLGKSPHVVNAARYVFLNWPHSWTPTLSQFRRLLGLEIARFETREETRRLAALPAPGNLEPRELSPIAREELEKMRQMLRGGRRQAEEGSGDE